MFRDLAEVSDSIDRLVTIDLNGRGVVDILSEAAKNRTKEPISLSGARILKNKVRRGDVVLIATGFPCRPWVSWEYGEPDGPAGAAALARALGLALGAVPVLVCDTGLIKLVSETCTGLGVPPMPLKDATRAVNPVEGYYLHGVVVQDFTSDLDRARNNANVLIRELNPAAMIAIERPGMNSKGVYHSMKGINLPAEGISKIDLLFAEARSSKIPTIGIGDGGNELGMGSIGDAIRARIPFGAKCKCPCMGGIADSTETDVTCAATVSNWGAYGIEACLALLSEDPKVMHTGQDESRMLEASAHAGAITGISGLAEPIVDGLSKEIHIDIVELLGVLVRKWVDQKLKPDHWPRSLTK